MTLPKSSLIRGAFSSLSSSSSLFSSPSSTSFRHYATSLKGRKGMRRMAKKYPKNTRQKMEPLSSQTFEAQPLVLSEPQIMYQSDTPGFDSGLISVLKNPYLTSHQPAESLATILYQQHLLNLADAKRQAIRDEYTEAAVASGRMVPQLIQGKPHLNGEDYARIFEQRLVKAWAKRNWHKTLKIVDEMERMNVPLLKVHYETIIGNLVDCGEYPRAEYFVDQMLENQAHFSSPLFEKLIQGCLHGNDLALAHKYIEILNEAGLILDYQGYIYLMKLYLKNAEYDAVDRIFSEMQEVGHASTEESWVLRMRAKALQRDSGAVDALISDANNDDFPLSVAMLNELLRSFDVSEKEMILQFFKNRYTEEKLERDIGTYEILLEKLFEMKDYESVYTYYNDLMDHAINPPFVKPTDAIFLTVLKAAKANNFDEEKTEEVWRDMKRMDGKRKYHPEWNKPLHLKEAFFYKVKARFILDKEHHDIITEVRKVAWIRKKLASLEKSENDYQRRKALNELRNAANKGGLAYATYDGEDFIPLARDEVDSIKNATRLK